MLIDHLRLVAEPVLEPLLNKPLALLLELVNVVVLGEYLLLQAGLRNNLYCESVTPPLDLVVQEFDELLRGLVDE